MSLTQLLDEALNQHLQRHMVRRRGKDRLRALLPFHAPCPQLCRQQVNAKGFHLTCLTCPVRKVEFHKRGWQNYMRKDPMILIMHSVNGKGFLLPKSYDTYGLIIPKSVGKLRRQLIKMILTVAERLAEA